MRSKLTTIAAAGCLAALLIVPSAASAHGTHLKAKMTGEQVVGQPGAPNGEGKARMHVLKKKGRLCFKVEWTGIGSTKGLNVGVYSGAAGANGNEVVALPLTNETNRSIEGCANATKSILKKLNRNPHLYHVNVKTDKYPTDGAIRGQLKS
jgi:CHRD domain